MKLTVALLIIVFLTGLVIGNFVKRIDTQLYGVDAIAKFVVNEQRMITGSDHSEMMQRITMVDSANNLSILIPTNPSLHQGDTICLVK